MQKESPNGEAEWQLASNKWVVVLTSVMGKKTTKGKNIPKHHLLL
jgi:hypothetical protein